MASLEEFTPYIYTLNSIAKIKSIISIQKIYIEPIKHRGIIANPEENINQLPDLYGPVHRISIVIII